MEVYGKKLRNAMWQIRMSVNSLSNQTGVSRPTIYRALNGDKQIQLSTARKITAKVLHELEIEKSKVQAEMDRLLKASTELRRAFDAFGGFDDETY